MTDMLLPSICRHPFFWSIRCLLTPPPSLISYTFNRLLTHSSTSCSYHRADNGAETSGGEGTSSSSRLQGGVFGRGSVWEGTQGGRRMGQRLIGQLNISTDIKEVAFLGPHDSLVAAGSDDGHVFIYHAVRGCRWPS